MPNKNEKLLREFTEYCRANPSLRFWQALSNWSGEQIIFRGDRDSSADYGWEMKDPYYFENKNN